MANRFQIRREGEIGSTVILHTSLIQKFGLSSREMKIWRFGLQKCEVNIISSEQIGENEVVMTKEVIDKLILPLIPEYEIQYKDNEFQIGPLIGIVAGKNLTKLNENIHKLSRYVRKYGKIGGAILAFSNEGIDREKKLIFGYLYHPAKKKWEKGIYPYPLAIFKKNSLKKEVQRHFESVIGKRIFNSSTFDKWEMYTWFKNASDIKDFLPDTKIFRTIVNVEQMLEKYHAAYIKPIKGMQGKKVAKIEERDGKIIVQYIEEDVKKDYYFKELYDAKNFLETTFGEEKFIVQQPLNLSFSDSIIDFRIIMIKDQTGKWKNFGIMGRNGVKGHIVSNRHRGGKVEQADITLATMFNDQSKILEYKQKMENVALKAAHTIENCGFLFGKLGIDIGIDNNGRVWLIEINHRNPNDFVASFSGDKKLVNVIRLANMRYAKRLAGF